jgi:hypothetical protein
VSWNPTAHIVVGFELDKVCVEKSITTKKKKFNEDTGEPYFVDKKKKSLILPDGKELKGYGEKDAREVLEYDHAYLSKGFEFFEDSDCRNEYVGIELSSIETNPYEKSQCRHSAEAVQDAFEQVKGIVKELGWLIELEPNLYLVM